MTTRTRSRRSRRFSRTVALVATTSALVCASVGLLAAPASAGLLSTVAGVLPSCAARTTTSTPFAPWGDTRAYFLMPGGGFESGTPGLDPRRQRQGRVRATRRSFVNAKTDTHSLAIPTGATVVSPTVCVAMGENTIRLFVKNSGVAASVLHVQASVQNPLTGLVLSTGFDIKGSAGATGWAPSSPILFRTFSAACSGRRTSRLSFTSDRHAGDMEHR